MMLIEYYLNQHHANIMPTCNDYLINSCKNIAYFNKVILSVRWCPGICKV